jgi:hypothetical protein
MNPPQAPCTPRWDDKNTWVSNSDRTSSYQQVVKTPHLQQAITLLQLSRIEQH